MSIFKSIPIPRLKRNVFNLSHDVKLTSELGTLVPVLCQPVLPADKWTLSTDFVCRLNPLIAPVMHDISVSFHTFFVPNRIIWSNWEKFITAGVDGTDKPVLPYFTPFQLYSYCKDTNKAFNSTLGDYLGIPMDCLSNHDVTTHISQMPFRAYQQVFFDWYRDETLNPYNGDEHLWFVDNDGLSSDSDVSKINSLQRRCWSKDYFTGALPWPQRHAGEDVTLPISGTGSLSYKTNPVDNGGLSGATPDRYIDGTVGNTLFAASKVKISNGQIIGDPTSNYLSIDNKGQLVYINKTSTSGQGTPVSIDLNRYLSSDQINKLRVDLDNGQSVTINQLREAIRLQQWYENNARGGSRYVEQLLSHFGVRSKDARLQRSEYLGGFKAPINISEVLQTSESNSTPLGKQGGHGFALNAGKTITRYFDEHGYILVIMSIRPRASYMQGIPRDFLKTDNLDFYFPEFANLGEQPIYEAELWNDPDVSDNSTAFKTFGYSPRYAEYKYIPSRVCGDFRSSMDYYHMARKFKTEPKLNNSFVSLNEKSDGLDRVFAALSENGKEYQHYWFDVAHNIKVSRVMPRYGVPKLI